MQHPQLTRRGFLKGACAGTIAAVFPFGARAARTKQRPNIVVILSDDQGWGDLRLHGNLNIETLNIDSLARDGAMFERFFVCPVCAPTRAEFLTGRYHPRGGVHGVTTGAERLNLDEKTIGDTPRRHSANGTTARNTPTIRTDGDSTSITASAPATGATTSIPFSNITAKSSEERDSSSTT
jgi:hypothetical protein